MLEHLNRCWRLCATAISFGAFGIGGVLLRVLVFPLLQLFVREPAARIRAARTVIRWVFRAFVGLMRLLGVLRYDVRGLDKLNRGGQLILANHPSLIDTVFLMAFVRQADCIVKSQLWNNPFTGGPVRAAAYVSNESGAALIDDCIASLKAGNNLIVFPEGTRTPACGSIQFKRGAANIAVRGACTVTPVVIDCQPATLGKGEPWWRIPHRRVQFTLDVRDDIDITAFCAQGKSEVMAVRQLTDHLQQFFIKESQGHA